MVNRLWQIFLTYVRRLTFWLILIFAGLIGFGQITAGARVLHALQRAHEPGPEMWRSLLPALAFLPFTLVYYVGFVIQHLKQQIASPRAATVPHYRLAHLVVAGCVLVPPMIIIPLVLMWSLHLPMLPILAIELALSALVAWALYMSNFLILAALAFWFTLRISAIGKTFSTMILGGNVPLAWLILLGGVGAISLLVYRMLTLSEDKPEYARNQNVVGWENYNKLFKAQAQYRLNTSNRWLQFFLTPSAGQLSVIGPHEEMTFWRRVRRWNVIAGGNRSYGLFVSFIMIVTMALVLNLPTHDMTMIWIPAMMPSFIVLGAAVRRWPMLGYEMLRPMTRRQFLIEQTCSLLLQLATAWVFMFGALVLMLALFEPALLSSSQLWMYLGFGLLFQLLMSSCALWLFRYRNYAIYIGLIMVTSAMLPMSMVFGNAFARLPTVAITFICAGAIGVALVILADAYRRWLVTDMA